MTLAAVKLMDAGDHGKTTSGAESPLGSVAPAMAVLDDFVPATKAQVAYWRQLCGAVSSRGKAGMPDTEWPPEMAPNRFTLRALEEQRLLVRRSRAWRLRRGWYAVLTLLRLTAVPTPPLLPAERPGPTLPTFAEVEQWDLVCRWLDTQPSMRARLPIVGVPGLPVPGAVSSEMLRGMRKYRLVRHGDDCTWRLSPTWKARLATLWQGIVKTEGEREPIPSDAPAPIPSDAPAPYSVAAGIDTWYLNRIYESGLPTTLHMALDDLQAQAKDEDDEVETPWEYDGAPLMLYRAGVSARQGGGVSWSYILRNPSLTLLIRKTPLGGIIAQARLGSECLWRLTPLAALNELDLLVRRLWQMGTLGKLGRIRHMRSASASALARWQVSQVHLAHDVAHAPLAVDQVDRYVSRSRKQSVFEAARQDLSTLYTGLDDPLNTVFADDTDAQFMAGLDWEELYGDEDAFGFDDPFAVDDVGWSSSLVSRRAVEEPEPVEERASSLHRWRRRVSGITWSPGAAVSVVAYDKVLEGRLRGKSHMPPMWTAKGWDGTAPVTRHEARWRREALRARSATRAWMPPGCPLGDAEAPAGPLRLCRWTSNRTRCGQRMSCASRCGLAVAGGARSAGSHPFSLAHGSMWAVVQTPQFTEAPVEVRHLMRREVRSQQSAKRDRARTVWSSAGPPWRSPIRSTGTSRTRCRRESASARKKPRSRARTFTSWCVVVDAGRWAYRSRQKAVCCPSAHNPCPCHPPARLTTKTLHAPMRATTETQRSRTTLTTPNDSRSCGPSADSTNSMSPLDAATHAAEAVPTHTHRRRVEELARAYEHELQVHETIRLHMNAEEGE